jgi:hypothetical protein
MPNALLLFGKDILINWWASRSYKVFEMLRLLLPVPLSRMAIAARSRTVSVRDEYAIQKRISRSSREIEEAIKSHHPRPLCPYRMRSCLEENCNLL